jgi:hypothetical protein
LGHPRAPPWPPSSSPPSSCSAHARNRAGASWSVPVELIFSDGQSHQFRRTRPPQASPSSPTCSG